MNNKLVKGITFGGITNQEQPIAQLNPYMQLIQMQESMITQMDNMITQMDNMNTQMDNMITQMMRI